MKFTEETAKKLIGKKCRFYSKKRKGRSLLNSLKLDETVVVHNVTFTKEGAMFLKTNKGKYSFHKDTIPFFTKKKVKVKVFKRKKKAKKPPENSLFDTFSKQQLLSLQQSVERYVIAERIKAIKDAAYYCMLASGFVTYSTLNRSDEEVSITAKLNGNLNATGVAKLKKFETNNRVLGEALALARALGDREKEEYFSSVGLNVRKLAVGQIISFSSGSSTSCGEICEIDNQITVKLKGKASGFELVKIEHKDLIRVLDDTKAHY